MKATNGVSILSGAVLSMLASTVVAAETNEEFDPEKFFKQGMEERESGSPYNAIESFQTILSNQPALHRARLELAVAYMQTLQYQEAEAQAQEVLNDPKTPPSVRVSILAFLAQLKKDAEQLTPQHEHKFNVNAGVLHDSNVNVGPGSSVIDINGSIATINTRPVSDNALVLSGSYDHSYRTGKPVRIGQKTCMLFWQSGASIYHRGYETEDDFNLDVLSVRTGPALVTNSNWRANLALQVDHIRLGGDELANYVSLQPSVTWSFDASTELTVDAEISDRDFDQANDQGRDSDYYSFGVALGKGYKNNTIGVQVGLEWYDNDAKEAEYSYDGWEAFVGANWQVKPTTSLFSRLSYSESDYDGEVTGVGKIRDDEEFQYMLGGKHLFGNDYELSAYWLRTVSDSNVELYEYNRNQLSINVGRKF